VRAKQSVSSLISGHAGFTSHAAIASQLPVQQPFVIVGTWPLGHVGCAVVHVTVPPQLPFGSVPVAHVPLSHQPKPCATALASVVHVHVAVQTLFVHC
jgi:hypothetical protein